MLSDDILEYLLKGQRLDQPAGCIDAVYELMASCWTRMPSMRPACLAAVDHLYFAYVLLQSFDAFSEQCRTMKVDESAHDFAGLARCLIICFRPILSFLLFYE